MSLQGRGDARQQPGRIGSADLHDLLVEIPGGLEPADARRRRHVIGGNRGSRIPDKAGGELRGLAFALIERGDDVGIAVDSGDQLLAQQPRRRRRSEPRRHLEGVNGRAGVAGHRGREHPQRIQRQHPGGLVEQPTLIGRDHAHGVHVGRPRRHQAYLNPTVGRQRKQFRINGIGFGQRFTTHHHPAFAHQLPDQRRLPVTPHPRTGGQRVGLGKLLQQLQQQQIAPECIDHGVNGFRVAEITPGGGVGQQQVVPHDLGQQVHIGRPQSQPGTDLHGQIRPDNAVITAAPLADVVHQCAKNQQIGARDPGGEGARLRDRFDKMPVDRPDVHDVTRRQIPNRPPFREEPAPQPGSVQRLDGGDRVRTGLQEHQQVLECLSRPRRTKLGCRFGKTTQCGGGDRQSGGRRCRRHPQDQRRVSFWTSIAGKHHLPGMLHHTLVDRTPDRAPQYRNAPPGNRITGRPQPYIHRIADGAGGVGQHSGQIKPIADTQRRTDLVSELSQQLIALPSGDPVQFGAHIQDDRVRAVERLRQPAIGELGDGQRPK